ncbi:DNA mismatch repair protein MutS [Dehalococcoides mccartyi]|uniref:DNA mismatch repair protein MutS n=1 Tax=Dehalococcoides mccartyi TaxID=61435 RepID=A0A0V8LY40_9CHLR|nr:hypothetical protein [Dehalococcoides mccartyi]KSV16439.1 DNA mismatch repair protein MutS [Dehalococcoides mccartyi]
MDDRLTDTKDIERSILRYNNLFSGLLVLILFTLIVSIYLIITINPAFAFCLLFLIPLVIIMTHISGRRRAQRFLLQIRTSWGNSHIPEERNFQAIRPLFDYIYSAGSNSNYIDEQTWKDLNMNQLYSKIDRTYTDPGQSVLYKILRTPVFDKETLEERNRVISFFQNNHDMREKIQLRLMNLGHQSMQNDVFNLVWRDEFPKSKAKILLFIMASVSIASLIIPAVLWPLSVVTASVFWSEYIGLVLALPVIAFLANLIIHYYIKRRKDIETSSFPYLIECINTAKRLASIKCNDLKNYTLKLNTLSSATQSIIKKAKFLFPPNQDYNDPATGFMWEYLNIFFLLEIRAFYNTADEISRHIHELRELYLTLGELDAWQSAASYRTSLSTYSEPIFVTNGIRLNVKNAKQPLLENPVPASISFKKNVVIITGSNMGGKSTFLRNIGTNALLSQTIATAVSSQYQGSFFRIITSISRTDDLIAGKSFYYAEAERILKTIQSFNKEIPTLCIIDELLSGTNSTERLHASEAIISYLTKQNVLAIVATHDMELAGKLNNTCDFYHFTDNVDETGLKFDYLLKPGIATTQNAIALLKYLGYPKEITERASAHDPQV